MKEKEYPMPETYNKALASLANLIEARDKYAARLKYTAPDYLETARKTLAELNKAIEEGEAKMAAEYEDYQKTCREDEESDKEWEQKMRKAEMMYVFFKHRMPDQLYELEKPILEYVAEYDDVEAFHDRIAILEATKLDEILDEKNLDKFDL